MRWGGMNVSPALRYTRWGRDANTFLTPTKPDQLELLVGFSFATEPSARVVGSHKLWFGFIGGFPFTNDIDLTHAVWGAGNPGVRFVPGFLAEVDLSERFSVEANGIYRSLRFKDSSQSIATWQIPGLAKYKFGSGASGPLRKPDHPSGSRATHMGPTRRPLGSRQAWAWKQSGGL